MANRFFSYHNTALRILSTYQKEMPLHHFLKQFFAKDKKYGSKDRRWISHFCYSFYRLGKALKDCPMEDRLMIGVYLCTEDLSPLQGYFPESWPLESELDKKVAFQEDVNGFHLEDIFPYETYIMPELATTNLVQAMLVQPDVFLRIRPGRKGYVLSQLTENEIAFRLLDDDCIAVKNRTAIDKVLAVNKDVVIQDYNSQRISELFPKENMTTVWDCCAASGGKSLLLHDVYPKANITVSDIRNTILQNHKKRMQEAGVQVKKYVTMDLSQPVRSSEQFDLVLCDAPCSGSGTWGRNPEELYFFDPVTLKEKAQLQTVIANNIKTSVRVGGYLLYLTCSVFKIENLPLLDTLTTTTTQFTLIEKRLFKGAGLHADNLFGCLLQRNA